MQTQVKEVRSKIVTSMKVFSFLYDIIYSICAMQYEIGMRIGKFSSMIRLLFAMCFGNVFSLISQNIPSPISSLPTSTAYSNSVEECVLKD